jgi:hypothetical protein
MKTDDLEKRILLLEEKIKMLTAVCYGDTPRLRARYAEWLSDTPYPESQALRTRKEWEVMGSTFSNE